MADQVRAVRALVHGRVQGVGFRFFAEDAAERYGVTGWVKNLPSGDVEAWVEGDPVRVAKMLAWLQQGPSSAYVTRVDTQEWTPQGLKNFRITG